MELPCPPDLLVNDPSDDARPRGPVSNRGTTPRYQAFCLGALGAANRRGNVFLHPLQVYVSRLINNSSFWPQTPHAIFPRGSSDFRGRAPQIMAILCTIGAAAGAAPPSGKHHLTENPTSSLGPVTVRLSNR